MMKHEPAPDPATIRADVTIVQNYIVIMRPAAGLICGRLARPCMRRTVDGNHLHGYRHRRGPVRQWRPGDPVPPEWFEAAANPDWVAVAHNDAFESAIEQHILHPRHGFPLVPPDRHRCTQATALRSDCRPSLARWPTYWNYTSQRCRRRALMHQTSKPRRPRFGEDPDGIYWFEDRTESTAR